MARVGLYLAARLASPAPPPPLPPLRARPLVDHGNSCHEFIAPVDKQPLKQQTATGCDKGAEIYSALKYATAE